jgi:outer membrane receptor protein involved in Fe transport
VTTYEIAYVQRVRRFGQGSITYFHTHIHDIIQPPENLLPYRNLGSSIMGGLELELRTRSIFGFNLLGTYTHLFPREEEKSQITVPLHFGSMSLAYTWRMLMVDVRAVMRGASHVGGYVATSVGGTSFLVWDQPAHTLLGTHLQIEVFPEIKAFGLVENILDHQFERANGLPSTPGLLTRGRTFMVGVRADL